MLVEVGALLFLLFILHHYSSWIRYPMAEDSLGKLALPVRRVSFIGWFYYLVFVKLLYILRAPLVFFKILYFFTWEKLVIPHFILPDPKRSADLEDTYRRLGARLIVNSSLCCGFVKKLEDSPFLLFRYKDVYTPRHDGIESHVKQAEFYIDISEEDQQQAIGTKDEDEGNNNRRVAYAILDGKRVEGGETLYNLLNGLMVFNSHGSIHALGGSTPLDDEPEEVVCPSSSSPSSLRRRPRSKSQDGKGGDSSFCTQVPLSMYASIQGLNLAANYWPGNVAGVTTQVGRYWSQGALSPTFGAEHYRCRRMSIEQQKKESKIYRTEEDELISRSWYARIVAECHEMLAKEFRLHGVAAARVIAVWVLHDLDHWCIKICNRTASRRLSHADPVRLTMELFGAPAPFPLVPSWIMRLFDRCPKRRKMRTRLIEVVERINPEAAKFVDRGVWCQ